MRLKLKFLSKCLLLHPGEKFQVPQLLQGEGRGLFAKARLSGKPLGHRQEMMALRSLMEEHPELAGGFSIEHTTAGGIMAGCVVGHP